MVIWFLGYHIRIHIQIAESTVLQAIKTLEIEIAVEITDNISEAEALLALQSKIRKNPRIKSLATSHGIPVYVTKVTEKNKTVLEVFKYSASLTKRNSPSCRRVQVFKWPKRYGSYSQTTKMD